MCADRPAEASTLTVSKRVHVVVIIKQIPVILIVVLPCMLTITQLLLQQNADFYY
jgi:hypothetical protein